MGGSEGWLLCSLPRVASLRHNNFIFNACVTGLCCCVQTRRHMRRKRMRGADNRNSLSLSGTGTEHYCGHKHLLSIQKDFTSLLEH